MRGNWFVPLSLRHLPDAAPTTSVPRPTIARAARDKAWPHAGCLPPLRRLHQQGHCRSGRKRGAASPGMPGAERQGCRSRTRWLTRYKASFSSPVRSSGRGSRPPAAQGSDKQGGDGGESGQHPERCPRPDHIGKPYPFSRKKDQGLSCSRLVLFPKGRQRPC